MKRITYLLGAGASANAVPIISGFAQRLKDFLLAFHRDMDGVLTDDEKMKHLHLLDQILPQIIKFRSPDTLAKNYSLTNKLNELHELKNLLSCFLIYEQLEKYRDWDKYKKLGKEDMKYQDEIHNTLDSRYLSFLATIMKINENLDRSRLPSNVNVISWNYDSQLERAYQEFAFSESLLSEVQEDLQCYPTIKLDEVPKPPLNQLKRQFNHIKLNGTSAFTDGDDSDLFNFKKHCANGDSYDIMKQALFLDREKLKNRLHFAWEDDIKFTEEGVQLVIPPINIERKADRSQFTELQEARFRAMNLFEASDIIVVIGYSFPDFNRRVDKEIFSKFRGKLVIQSPEADKIKQKIRGVNPEIKEKDMETMTEKDSFFIPYEFWEE
jgi:hypothetical protein